MTNFTTDQLALQAHIEAENVKTQAWLDAAEGRWAGMVVSDPEHWAGYNIFTIAGYEHYMAACDNFEMIRERDGYKPSWARYASMTTEQIEADTEAMCEYEAGRNAKRDAEAATLAASLNTDVETLERWGVL